MLLRSFTPFIAALLTLAGGTSAHAQRAPGEDPVHLQNKVSFLSLPGPAAAKSGSLEGSGEMPAWLKAKVARFEAKSFSGTADDGTLLNDNDVTNTSSTQGVRRTCRQDIGSTQTSTGIGRAPTAGGARTNANQQIVVLRGDVVNICR